MNLPIAILIVVGAGAVAALAHTVVHLRVRGPLLTDSGRGRPMVTVTGTLFTVVLAFVILAAFETYDGARSGAATEANAVLAWLVRRPSFPPRSATRCDPISSVTAARS